MDDRPWLNLHTPLERKEGAIGAGAHGPVSRAGADWAVRSPLLNGRDPQTRALYAGEVLHGRDLERARLAELLEAAPGRAGRGVC